jgi:OmpA family protein
VPILVIVDASSFCRAIIRSLDQVRIDHCKEVEACNTNHLLDLAFQRKFCVASRQVHLVLSGDRRSGSGRIDPVAASAPPPQQTGPAVGARERARGAARGAVGGAVIGDIAGDAGTGAGVGAAAGVMAGGAKARRNQAEQNEQAKQQQQQTLNNGSQRC